MQREKGLQEEASVARTVGFSLGEEEEARLDRLVRRRGSPNRSRFLREALEVVERYDRVRDLEALQGYGELRAVQAGVQPDEIPDLVARVATLDDAALREQADTVLEAVGYDRVEDVRTPSVPLPAAQALLEGLRDDETRGPGAATQEGQDQDR